MRTRHALLSIAMGMLAVPGLAQDKPAPYKPRLLEREVISSEAFLNHHPDMLNRKRAMEALDREQPEAAASYFLRAARYADKQSQAAYAEMLWSGHGVARDRPLAYAWMDLAAERGFRVFLIFRERYWAGLDEAERRRALEVGEEVYAQYGDAVAKPRLERILRRGKRQATGSRTGFVGALRILIPGPGGEIEIGGDQFYDKRYWEPERYWQWQQEIVEGMRPGRVLIGEPERAPDARAKPEQGQPRR